MCTYIHLPIYPLRHMHTSPVAACLGCPAISVTLRPAPPCPASRTSVLTWPSTVSRNISTFAFISILLLMSWREFTVCRFSFSCPRHVLQGRPPSIRRTSKRLGHMHRDCAPTAEARHHFWYLDERIQVNTCTHARAHTPAYIHTHTHLKCVNKVAPRLLQEWTSAAPQQGLFLCRIHADTIVLPPSVHTSLCMCACACCMYACMC